MEIRNVRPDPNAPGKQDDDLLSQEMLKRRAIAEALANNNQGENTPTETPSEQDKLSSTLETLAPSKYSINPALADYLTQMRAGKDEAAAQERKQNALFQAFDAVGQARANEWGSKYSPIGDTGDSAQKAALVAEGAVDAANLKDIQGHIDRRGEIARALASKRETQPNDKPFFRGTGAITRDTLMPVNMVGFAPDGSPQYASMDGKPVDPSNILTKDIQAQDVKQKENLAKVLADPQGIATSVQALEKELGFVLESADIPSGKDIIKVGGKEVDLPGVSTRVFGRQPGIPFTDDFNKAKDLDAKIGSIFNSTLHLRSGSAVTDSEFKRLRDEFSQGKFNTEAAMIKALKDFKANLAKTLQNKEAGFKPEVLNEYRSSGGLTSDQFLPNQGIQQAAQPQTSGATGSWGEGQSPQAPQQSTKRIKKTQVSPSTGKTKIIYDDGTEEIK